MPSILVQEFEEASSSFFDEYVVTIEERQVRRSPQARASIVVRELLHSSATTTSRGESHSSLSWIYLRPIRILRYALHSVARYLRNLFLPLGYPDTVRAGYWEYQVYDSIQGLCSYLRGVVSSAHVLQAAGVGNDQATAWGAAVTWALRDGMGLLGGLVFSAAAAPLFDAHVKEFRFFADLINNVGLTLDMLLPLLPASLFLWSSAASTLCKTMCGMSAGATKGSITQHFAISGNLGTTSYFMLQISKYKL